MRKLKILPVATILIFSILYPTQGYPEKKKNKGKEAIILCFHDINGQGKYSIKESEFDEILNLLKDKYEVYSLEKWHLEVERGKVFLKQPVVLTFDDGYESVFNIVIPKLKKRSYGATFFIYLDRYNDHSSVYKYIATLSPEFEIGSHSFSHADMQDLFEKDPSGFFREIFLSRKKLSYLTGRDIKSWAWPYGYYNVEMEQMARYAGYQIQVNTDYKRTDKQWELSSFSRFTVQNPDPVNQVKEILEKNQTY